MRHATISGLMITLLCLLPSFSAAGNLLHPGLLLDDLSANLLKHGYRTAYATGDFNGDGFNDLAVGIPYATVDGHRAAGKVVVINGDALGLTRVFSTYHEAAQGKYRVPGGAEQGDLVGFSLAAGDFNGDGIIDLAVGAPGKDPQHDHPRVKMVDAGVMFAALGVRGAGLDFGRPGGMFTQAGRAHRFRLPGDVYPGALLGFSLAAGDFDGDGFDDVAVGLPGKAFYDSGGKFPTENEGAVIVVAGTAEGPWGQGSRQPNSQKEFGEGWRGCYNLSGSAHKGDCVGYALAAGDFDGDGFDDLAIGAPGEDVEIGDAVFRNAGALKCCRGTRNGLDARPFPVSYGATGNGRLNLGGSAQTNAFLGFSVAAGDFNGDDRDDVAVGAPGRDVGAADYAGAVVVAAGAAPGNNGEPILDGSVYPEEFSQDGAAERYDFPGRAQNSAYFGFSVAAGDFDFSTLSRHCDLAIGAPGITLMSDSAGFVRQAGAVFVRFGSEDRGVASNRSPLMLSQTASEESEDLWDDIEEADNVGYGVAAGPLGTGPQAELIISAPGERLENRTLGDPLEHPFEQMFVDGMTHVVFGREGVGPDARQEFYNWFDRFTRGVQVDSNYVKSLFDELMQDTMPLSSPDTLLTVSSIELLLKPFTDPALGPQDELYTQVTYVDERAHWLGEQWEFEVNGFGVFFPDGRNLGFLVRAFYEKFGLHQIYRAIMMPGGDLWSDPVQTILLPNYAVEVIAQP